MISVEASPSLVFMKKRIYALLITSFLFYSPISYALDELIDVQSLQKIKALLIEEESLVSAPKHATKFHLQKNREGQEIKTERVFVIIHGLYNSSYDTLDLQNLILQKYHQNTVAIRLASHYEKVPENLNLVKSQDWLDQLNELRPLLHKLGQNLVFIGHSAGGLLALISAMEQPEFVESLILFAPALQISNQSLRAAKAGVRLGTGFYGTSGRYYSPFAAMELHHLGSDFLQSLKEPNQLVLSSKLLVIDTAKDIAVNYDQNLKIAETLKARGSDVQYERLSRRQNISHAKLMRGKSPGLDFIAPFLSKISKTRTQL